MRRPESATLADDFVARLTLPIEELWRLADRLMGWQPDDPDRRNSRRFHLSRPLMVYPLSDDFEPLDEPVVALARNLSRNGLALVTPRGLDARYLRLSVSDGGEKPDGQGALNLYLEVSRCQRFGETFEIAGRFVNAMETRTN